VTAIRKIANSFGVLLLGNIAAQIIGLSALLLLARVYSPHEFGVLQLHMSVCVMFFPIVSLRYEYVILSANNDADVLPTLLICAAISVVFAILIFLLLSFLSILGWSIPKDSLFLVWSLPLAAMFGGMNQYASFIPTRNRTFRIAAVSRVLQSTLYAGLALAIAFLLGGQFGLIVSDLAARGATGAFILISWLLLTGANLDLRNSWRRGREIAHENRNLAILGSPGALMNAAAGALTPIAVFSIYGSGTAGQYSLADRTVLAPVALLAFTASQVFSGELSRAQRSGEPKLSKLFRKVVVWGSALAILPTILVALFAEVGIVYLFGQNWKSAGEIAQLLAPLIFVALAVSPVTSVLVLTGHQKVQFAWEGLRLGTAICAWTWSYHSGLPLQQAVLLSVALTIPIYAIYLFLADRMLTVSDNRSSSSIH
jgi:O-antigen/teichoic acid export membrane protein